MSTYRFEKPLIRGTMLKRKSQFTALVDIDGEELIAHIPTTNRIGDVENKNLPCLLSYHDDPKRKLKYDIEAVLLSDDDNWIGINQILSNRLESTFFMSMGWTRSYRILTPFSARSTPSLPTRGRF